MLQQTGIQITLQIYGLICKWLLCC